MFHLRVTRNLLGWQFFLGRQRIRTMAAPNSPSDDAGPLPDDAGPLPADAGPLSADEISAQASALAEHLHQAGVQFLPQPRAETVQGLMARFAAPALDSTAAGSPTLGSGAAASSPAEHLRDSDRAPSDESPRHDVPGSPDVPGSAANRAIRQSPPVTLVEQIGDAYPGDPVGSDERQSQLAAMAGEVAACLQCKDLADCRKNTVFGEGSPTPRVAFFGEAPGADEDREGRPFVGKAGQLLTKMIEACTFRREDVYILNTLKCRPPGNRNPLPEEVDHCREFFQRQLSILRPQYIVCLGAVSSQTLLRSKLPVGRLRGKFHRYYDSKVLVTYHPAYLLRNPAAKKAVWEDLQMMLRDASIDPNEKK